MKKLLALLMTVMLGLSLISCGSGPNHTMGPDLSDNSSEMTSSEPSGQPTQEMDVAALVVYYSWSGNTRHIAERIAAWVEADLYEIRTVSNYPEDGRETAVVSQEERRTGNLPELVDDLPDLSGYDTIFIGGPVWNAYMPTPLESYLEQTDFSGKVVIPFSTSQGSGQTGFQNDFAERIQNPASIGEYKDFRFPDNYSPDAFTDAEIDTEVGEWLADFSKAAYPHITAENTVQDVIDHPAFAGFGGYILTSGDPNRYSTDRTLDNIGYLLPYHSHIDTSTTVNSINYLIDEVAGGKTIFYDYYSEEEQQEDPEKDLTGLIFLRGDPGAPFAVVSPGGGFSYNGSIHEGFPYAIALAERGYNAFILYYRMRGGVSSGEGVASEDLSAAISYILAHAEELEVGTEDYSVWGSSAGAIMSANVGSKGPAYYGYDVSKPCTVVMAYTRYTYFFTDAPPTFVCISDDDPIVMGGTGRVRESVNAMKEAGVDVEYHEFSGIGHGYGIGAGTAAEGWIEDAISFWETHMQR